MNVELKNRLKEVHEYLYIPKNLSCVLVVNFESRFIVVPLLEKKKKKNMTGDFSRDDVFKSTKILSGSPGEMSATSN